MCGENRRRAAAPRPTQGSPPRVRGKPAAAVASYIGYRITPACAGKTCSLRVRASRRRDHPRVCGENVRPCRCPRWGTGSPPRVRGKRVLRLHFRRPRGITPACAGKTCIALIRRAIGEDHPRVCGENFMAGIRKGYPLGSPPRVRGKLSVFPSPAESARITPACAGKTLRKWRISVVDPSPQPRSSLTSRKADASIGSQRAPCAAPV